jgi:hypothetical protein
VGRGARRWSVAAASIGLLGALVITALATADEEILQKGKLRSDGVLTVGQRETVKVKRMPPKIKVRVMVAANDQRCQSEKTGFCTPEPAKRAAGSKRFRTGARGRAKLTFVMPAAYDFLHLKPPFKSNRVRFTNGEPLLVQVEGDTAVIRHGESRHLVAVAQAKAVAEVLAPAP